MLRLSRKVDYGLAFLAVLAERPKKWVPLSEVARQRRISPKFLSQLVVGLREAGVVDSREGLHGGYRLAKAPAAIRIKEVVEALEGDTALVDCLLKPCPIEGFCYQKPMWTKVQSELNGLLSRISVADLARQKKGK